MKNRKPGALFFDVVVAPEAPLGEAGVLERHVLVGRHARVLFAARRPSVAAALHFPFVVQREPVERRAENRSRNGCTPVDLQHINSYLYNMQMSRIAKWDN